MSLEEDAMLVAIGRMSMDEAREKWADQWTEFCQSLSRWKSIHQLLRISRLNAIQQQISTSIEDTRMRIAAWNQFGNEARQYKADIEFTAEQIWFKQQIVKSQKDELAFGYNPRLEEEAPRTRRGKKIYQDHVRHAISVATMEQLVPGTEADLKQLDIELKENQEKLDLATAAVNQEEKFLVESKNKAAQLQDEIDISKPYAMGLLVADIFYSLAAALQGDIY